MELESEKNGTGYTTMITITISGILTKEKNTQDLP